MSLEILTPAVGDLLVHERFVLNHCEVVLSVASCLPVSVAERVRGTGEDEVDLVGIQSVRRGHRISISARPIPWGSYITDSQGGPFTFWSMWALDLLIVPALPRFTDQAGKWELLPTWISWNSQLRAVSHWAMSCLISTQDV